MFDYKYDRKNKSKKWINRESRYHMKKTIKCSCGYDTGLNQNGFLMVIPCGGFICPQCGATLIQDTRIDCLCV